MKLVTPIVYIYKYICLIYDLIIDCGMDLVTIIAIGMDFHCVLSNLDFKRKCEAMNMLTLQQPFAPLLNVQLFESLFDTLPYISG